MTYAGEHAHLLSSSSLVLVLFSLRVRRHERVVVVLVLMLLVSVHGRAFCVGDRSGVPLRPSSRGRGSGRAGRP